MCMYMATKNISITTEAYERLARLKKEKESFSEIITRITRKAKLDDFFGVISKESADEIKENIKDLREINKKTWLEKMKQISEEI